MFTDWAVKLHTKTAQAAAAVYIDGISDSSLNANLQTLLEAGDGSVYATFGSLVSGGPVAAFSTTDLKAFLDQCGLEGMLIDNDGTHPGVVMYFQKLLEGGTREAANAGCHISTTIENGIMVPRTIVLPHQGQARVTAEIVGRKVGDVDPIVFSETADLPAAIYPSVSAVHTLGKVDLDGTPLDRVQNVAIETGILLAVESSDGDRYPTKVSIAAIRPVVTVVCTKPEITATLTEDGLGYAAEKVIIYARHRAEGGTVVADATATHVKFTLGKCRADWTRIDGSPKAMALTLTPWYTAGAEPVSPLAINTASAIT